MNAVIYHNPRCGTSRNTLALIRHAGIEPEVIEYLADPPDRSRLVELITAAGLGVRDAIRQKGTPTWSSVWTTPPSVMTTCWMRCWPIRS